MMMENGGLHMYQRGCEMIVVRDGSMNEVFGPCFCTFGSHPKMVLWVENGSLHSVDLRKVEVCINYNIVQQTSFWYNMFKIPLCARQPPIVVEGNTSEITCLSLDSEYPFHLLMGTTRELILIDLREPTKPLLAIHHHLSHPPIFITLLHTADRTSILSFHGIILFIVAFPLTCYSSGVTKFTQ